MLKKERLKNYKNIIRKHKSAASQFYNDLHCQN